MSVDRAVEEATREAQRQWMMDAEVPGAEHVEVRLEDLFVEDIERLRQSEEARKLRRRRWSIVAVGLAVGLGLMLLAVGLRRTDW